MFHELKVLCVRLDEIKASEGEGGGVQGGGGVVTKSR